ncbi:hypothetical protein BGZ57DRAFT_970189 [Hyaloscypha finlandica]|nr:hypothetical protein BGZ57DRAFT_970189 [Hyaloscypha finlandica]
MCHTLQTLHNPCRHTLTTVHPCTASPGYLLPSFLSSIFAPPRCVRTSEMMLSDDFCPKCEEFWTDQGIGGEEARERIVRWRGGMRGRGASDLQPSTNQKSNPSSGERLKEGREEGSRSRRSSVSSTCTLWPGPVPHRSPSSRSLLRLSSSSSTSTETLFQAPSAEGEDLGTRRLDSLTLVQRDENGEAIEHAVPPPTWSVQDGLIHPDAFELDEWGNELSGPSNVEGFERQEPFKLAGPFPVEKPQGRKLV